MKRFNQYLTEDSTYDHPKDGKFQDEIAICPKCKTKYPFKALNEISHMGGTESPCCGVTVTRTGKQGTWQWDADESIATLKEDSAYGVNIVNAPVTGTLQTRVKRVNTYLADTIGRTYFENIPLQDIFDKCREQGLNPVQEDGTDWEGFLAGRDGRARIELVDMTGGTVRRYLSVTYHKMDVTGKWEVVAYVS